MCLWRHTDYSSCQKQSKFDEENSFVMLLFNEVRKQQSRSLVPTNTKQNLFTRLTSEVEVGNSNQFTLREANREAKTTHYSVELAIIYGDSCLLPCENHTRQWAISTLSRLTKLKMKVIHNQITFSTEFISTYCSKAADKRWLLNSSSIS